MTSLIIKLFDLGTAVGSVGLGADFLTLIRDEALSLDVFTGEKGRAEDDDEGRGVGVDDRGSRITLGDDDGDGEGFFTICTILFVDLSNITGIFLLRLLSEATAAAAASGTFNDDEADDSDDEASEMLLDELDNAPDE